MLTVFLSHFPPPLRLSTIAVSYNSVITIKYLQHSIYSNLNTSSWTTGKHFSILTVLTFPSQHVTWNTVLSFTHWLLVHYSLNLWLMHDINHLEIHFFVLLNDVPPDEGTTICFYLPLEGQLVNIILYGKMYFEDIKLRTLRQRFYFYFPNRPQIQL
jgi:hypothetical protein